jgi:hypothetical protein
MVNQSVSDNGTVRKISPPNWTIRIVPIRMARAM